MSAFVNKSAAIFLNGYKLTDITKINLDIECDVVEVTNHQSSGAREYTPGLVKGNLSLEGFANDTLENDYFSRAIAETSTLTTLFPYTFTATQTTNAGRAYSFWLSENKLSFGESIGELETFNLDANLEGVVSNNFINWNFVRSSTAISVLGRTDISDYAATGQEVSLNVTQYVVNGTSLSTVSLYLSSSSGSAAGTGIFGSVSTGVKAAETAIVWGRTYSSDRRFFYTTMFTSGSDSKALVNVGVR